MSLGPNHSPDARKILETAVADMWDNAEYKPAFLYFHLLQAAENGDLENVLSLLEGGAQIEAQAGTDGDIDKPTNNQKRLTPLHIAALKDCEATLGSLVYASANIEAPMGDGGVALHLAAENDHATILNIVLNKGARVGVKEQRENKATALHLAVSGGQTTTVEILLEMGANIESKNVNGKTPLHSTAQYGPEPVIITADIPARLTKGGTRGRTALHLASEAEHEIIVKTLLSSGLDVNARAWGGESALQWAVCRGHKAVGLALLRHSANTCMKGPNHSALLHWAVTSGQLKIVQLLIEQGAKPEEKTGSGETPLPLAALYGRTAAVEQLLDIGAGIQANNRNREEALHLASRNGKYKAVDLLLSKGANRQGHKWQQRNSFTSYRQKIKTLQGAVKLQQSWNCQQRLRI
ncbi:hypothetical protein MMC29_007972 [Sticta canariensis]|nr:hypothetical protein [Sticta canariensis]